MVERLKNDASDAATSESAASSRQQASSDKYKKVRLLGKGA